MSSAGRALVIEDEEELRALFAHVLKSAGFTVCEAAGGEEGIDKARRFEPNLIVLDLRLPGVSGFTVARVVRALERERVVVIVAVSGLASESLYHEALEAGVRRLLPQAGRAGGAGRTRSSSFGAPGTPSSPLIQLRPRVFQCLVCARVSAVVTVSTSAIHTQSASTRCTSCIPMGPAARRP